MTVFMTSDTHWYHTNILKYSKRPFKDIFEMNKALIDNWNAVVGPRDEIFHLGDFAFAPEYRIEEILNQLNGIKYFIRGNHDKGMRGNVMRHFQWSRDYYELKEDGQMVVLCHYPLMTWNKARHGSYMAHGHCHSSMDYANADTTRHDIGVDGNGYCPVSLKQLHDIMSKKTYKVVDHHGANGYNGENGYNEE